MNEDIKYLMPKVPSWRRYYEIFLVNNSISILRALQYEALLSINYKGKVLDFGGGDNAKYISLLRNKNNDFVYESINISESMNPTHLIRPEADLPISSETYDMVLAINTLEHVFNINNILKQLVSSLKVGGEVIFVTPFLFRVHGSPDDYNRPTAQWWGESLKRLGLSEITVDPLMWDASSAGLGLCEGVGVFGKIKKIIFPLYGILYAFLRAPQNDDRFPPTVGIHQANFALGYLVRAKKPV